MIIGGGPAGLTAGIYAARAQLQPIIIEGTTPGGQLMGTTSVENWPGEKDILGPKLMMAMRDHALHTGCAILSESVVSTDFSGKILKLKTNKDKEIEAQSVIIATGASPNRLYCPGESEYWGKGVTACAVCDGAFYPDRKVLIVGGGNTAVEDALFMTKYTDKITIVTIMDRLTAEATLQKRLKEHPEISIIYNSTVSSIEGDEGHVTNVTITSKDDKSKTKFDTEAVFLAIGLMPNTEPFIGQIELDQRGYVVINNSTKTSKPGVFVAGDVSNCRHKQAILASAAGCEAALDVEDYLGKL